MLSQAINGDEPILENLLPYAFFESILIGANYVDFLCDDLLSDGEKIVDFLGDFSGVILTEDVHTCGLVKQKGERLFEVEYFTVEIKDGKIADVRK